MITLFMIATRCIDAIELDDANDQYHSKRFVIIVILSFDSCFFDYLAAAQPMRHVKVF